MDESCSIVINRYGSCSGCGYCCGFRDGVVTEGSCRHLLDDGKCGIYEHRDEFCSECGHDHKDCITAPTFPLRRENPRCTYRFVESNSGVEVIDIVFKGWDFIEKYGD